MAKINGHDLLVYCATVAISHSTTCSITVNVGTMQTTSKDSAHWDDFLPGARNWTIDTSGMVALDATFGIEELYNLVNSRLSVALKFATSVATDRFFSGTAYITNLTVDAPDEAGATFSASFQGTSKLKYVKT